MIGQTISHYCIIEKLGEGGRGVVYKAEDTQLRRTVALKFLSSDTLEEQEVKARLIREAQAAASLDHPNICAVHGIHEEDGETFIAMAFIDGPSLAGKIKERPLPLEEALDIAIQIGEGLKEAHEKGIVHRDIKPANIMMTRKGQAKIMDFGLASLAGRSKLTKSGTTLGTPAYMAPEQLQAKQADHRADIWALGCALYEMLAQRTPFAAEYEQAIAYGILSEDPEPVTAVRSGIPVEIQHSAGHLDSRRHVCDLLLDELIVADHDAEHFALIGVTHSFVETALRLTNRRRTDQHALGIE
jgi:serine/threonine protein kinase